MSRARDIVRLASTKTRSPMLKAWLFNDEQGIWERDAQTLLDHSEALAKQHGLTEEQHNLEIACFLVLRGLEAVLKDAKKRRQEKRDRR